MHGERRKETGIAKEFAAEAKRQGYTARVISARRIEILGKTIIVTHLNVKHPNLDIEDNYLSDYGRDFNRISGRRMAAFLGMERFVAQTILDIKT